MTKNKYDISVCWLSLFGVKKNFLLPWLQYLYALFSSLKLQVFLSAFANVHLELELTLNVCPHTLGSANKIMPTLPGKITLWRLSQLILYPFLGSSSAMCNFLSNTLNVLVSSHRRTLEWKVWCGPQAHWVLVYKCAYLCMSSVFTHNILPLITLFKQTQNLKTKYLDITLKSSCHQDRAESIFLGSYLTINTWTSFPRCYKEVTNVLLRDGWDR